MRKKSGFTIVDQAIVLVPEFEKIYRDKAIKKPATLDGAEFLRRFCQHILPQRYLKIRRFGIYNHTAKRNQGLQFTPEEKPDIDTLIKRQQPTETNLQKLVRLTGFDPCLCPVCKAGRMVVTRELPRIRSPAGFLPSHFCPQF